MPRTSPVHYINPSDIALIPNCNNSSGYVGVSISRDAKIRVYSPKVEGLGFSQDGVYQEWKLGARNRYLKNGSAPYTIYARLPKNDYSNGYLIFSAKRSVNNEWLDKYNYVTREGLTAIPGAITSNDYWFIRMGDVSLPYLEQRTIEFDTGILGIDQYNNEFIINPDELPMRVELNCIISEEDAGNTPYVYWGQTLGLKAELKEGWGDTDTTRFHHWVITRNTDDAVGDAAWNAIDRSGSGGFGPTGEIALVHARGIGDDFNGVVSAVFTITAMGTPEVPTGQDEYEPLAQTSICIMAETWEKYELSLSSQMVTYNPQTKDYTPGDGVSFNIRAIDQKGEVFLLTNKQFYDAGLTVEYAIVGASPETWTTIVITGPDNAVAAGTVSRDVFGTNKKSVKVRLCNSANAELANATIAFLKDGEDSKEREWIYRLDTDTGYAGTTGTIGGDSSKPVSGQTGGIDNCLLTDDFVPDNWTDEPTGTSSSHDTEYTSYRDYDHENGRWGAFNTPTIWSHYGEDGQQGPPGVDGDDGEDAVVLTLDNPHQDFIFNDKDEKVSPASGVTSQAHLHVGPVEILPANITWAVDFTKSSGVPTSGQNMPTCVNGLLTVPTINALTAKVVVRATYPTVNGNYYYAAFTANKHVQDSYKLVITPDALAYNPADYATTRLKVYAEVTNMAGDTAHAEISTTSGSGTLRLFATYVKQVYTNVWSEVTEQVTSNVVEGNVVKHYLDIDAGRANHNTGIQFELRKYATGGSFTVKDSDTVEIAKVENGAQGSAGRMYYPAGEYSRTVEYTRNDNVCPVVHYTKNGFDMGYWYLDADTNVVSGQHVAPSSSSGNPWKEAANFGMVITEALFASFAKLGSFVVSGDFFISQYGTLYERAGLAVEVSPQRVVGMVYYKTDGLGKSIPYYADRRGDVACYTYFKADDPMAEGIGSSTFPKFRPTKVVNALTGEEWFAGGNMHVGMAGNVSMAGGNVYIDANGNVEVRGTIRATNLYHAVCYYRPGGEYNPAGDNTGDADIINLVPKTNNYEDDNNNYIDELDPYPTGVHLPDPATCVGKIVEIHAMIYGTGPQTFHVCCGTYENRVTAMVNAVFYDTYNYTPGKVIISGAPTDIKTFTTGKTIRMMAVRTDVAVNGRSSWWVPLE